MKIFNYLLVSFIFLINCKLVYSNQVEKFENNYIKFNIPNILSESDIKIYLEINKLLDLGKWDEVSKQSKLLKNKILLGYLEYDKLMHPNKYRATYRELLNWLEKYNDFPAVMQRRVYNLMVKRAYEEKKINNIKKPKYGNYLRGYGENKVNYVAAKINQERNKKFYVDEQVLNLIISQQFEKLLNYYNANNKSRLDIIHFLEKDGKKKYFKGLLSKSLETYRFLINKTKIEDPQIFFMAGLNAYRLKDYSSSINFFNTCNILIQNSVVKISPKLKSACLFWEGKLTSIQNKKNKLLLRASKFDRTMYGQLAIEKLNKKDSFVWNVKNYEKLKNKKINIYKLRVFQRLIALSELNFYDKADLEMRNLYSKLERNRSNTKLLLYLSEKLNLAAVQIRLGESFFNKDYILFMRGMYPTPEWRLEEGFVFDKAFIYAIIRRESAFNFRAKSSKGARGLMQLMPRTASKIKKDHRLRYGNKHQLYSLDLNLELGQKLLQELVKSPDTKNSILNTLIAYNAGITRVKKWNKNINEGDPLAFIESIPIKETRLFVKSILTDLWIYRDKLGQNKPTRTMLANDKWPSLPSQDFNLARDAKLR